MAIAKLGNKLGEIRIDNKIFYRIVRELRYYEDGTKTGSITYEKDYIYVIKDKASDYFRI